MREILKSRLFQLRRAWLLYAAFAVVLVLSAGMMFLMPSAILLTPQTVSGGMAAMLVCRLTAPCTAVLTMLLTSRIMCGDYSGGLIHCDVLSGHARGAVFFGRMLPALCLSAAASMAVQLLAVLSYTAVYGWGDALPFGVFLGRVLLAGLFSLRLSCEIVLLAVLLHRDYLVALAALGGWLFEYYFTLMAETKDSLVLAYHQCAGIMEFECRYVSHLDGTMAMCYQPGLFGGSCVRICVSSLAVGLLCTALAYSIFRWDDL